MVVVAQKRVKETTVHHHTDDLKDNAKGRTVQQVLKVRMKKQGRLATEQS